MHLPLLKDFRPVWPALMVSSLLLNAVLGYNLLKPQPPPASQSVLPSVKPMAAKAPARAFTSAKPFHWSQIDAPDFPTYAKNLRGIGCPEATIRDILAGELDEVYRQKEAQSGPGSKMNASERARQQTEREQLLAQLTQTTAPTSEAAAAPAFTQTGSSGAATAIMQSPNENAGTKTRTPVIPTAFAYGAPPGATGLQGGQAMLTAAAEQSQLPANTAASLKQMQSDFATELGDKTQDPASEEYQAAWNQATRKSDERFSSMYGGDVFVRTQLDTVRAASAASKTSH